MDSLDKDILMILQHQGRISMTDLGKAVSLSQPAVTERVRKMEDNGIIRGYRAVVPPEKANKPVSAYLLFHTKNCDSFVRHCEKTPDVLELHRISGQYNFLVKVVGESLRNLESAVNELGSFGDSTTLIVMSTPIEHRPVLPQIGDE